MIGSQLFAVFEKEVRHLSVEPEEEVLKNLEVHLAIP